MKSIPKIILLSLIVLFPYRSEGQLLNRIKNAAERGVSNAVERKVEIEAEKLAMRKMEQALQNIYGPEAMGSGGSGMDFSKIMSGINTNIETADSYSFTGYSIMEITTKDDKGKSQDPVNFKSYLSSDAAVMAMEFENMDKSESEGKTIMIYDIERSASIILMENEGEKMSMAYGFDFDKMSEGIPSEDVEVSPEMAEKDFSFKKTGNTKTILGYNCEEYLMESEDGNGIYWITDQPINSNGSLWGNNNPFVNSKLNKGSQPAYGDLPNGNMMEMTFTSKEDQSMAHMLVKEINESTNYTFSMAEYPNAFKSVEK